MALWNLPNTMEHASFMTYRFSFCLLLVYGTFVLDYSQNILLSKHEYVKKTCESTVCIYPMKLDDSV